MRTVVKKFSPLKQFLAIIGLFIVLQTFMITYKQEDRRRISAVRNITTRIFELHGSELQVKSQRKAVHIAKDEHVAHSEPRASTMNFAISNNFPALLTNTDSFFQGANDPLVCGTRRQHEGFLTIGIPSVRRPNTDYVYLFDTLDSLITKTNEADRNLVTIVVFLADFNATFNQHVSDVLITKYKHLCDKSFLHVLIAKKDIYPDMSKLRRNFNDSESRVIWRTKQNVDIAFLQLYSKNISQYYLHLEDDVLAATGYVQDIKKKIEASKNWFNIEFSKLGFIGQCFHSSDLARMVRYLLTFHDQMPCDWLFAHLQKLMAPRKRIKHTPSLFQHIGKFSSLKDKILPLVDDRFKDRGALNSRYDIPRGDNPRCSIETNMQEIKPYAPKRAYESNSSYFHTKTAHKGTYFKIVYQTPVNLSRIVIATGERTTKRDSLDEGTLSIYNTTDTVPSDKCGSSSTVLQFTAGDIDTKGVGFVVPDNIKCLQITAGKRRKSSLIIRHIAVFVRET